jgi:hypothetical protein
LILRRLGGVVLAGLAALGAAACGAPSIAHEGTAAKSVKPLALPALPPSLLGLSLKAEENKDVLDRPERTYFDRVSLYSLRAPSGPQKDLVQATLQISHFNSSARWRNEKFRSAIVTQLGGSTAQLLRLGHDDVFLTKGQQQTVTVWFRGPHLFILSVRQDFDRPRALLRSALQVQT